MGCRADLTLQGPTETLSSAHRWLLPPLPVAGLQRATELLTVTSLTVPQLRCQQEQGKLRPVPGAVCPLTLPTPQLSAIQTLIALHLQGKYLLTPSPITYGEEQLLHFLGQLLGIAIRADVPLPLDLLPSFWKTLVGEALDPEQDLQEADILTYNYVKKFESVSESPFSVCRRQSQGCIGNLLVTSLAHVCWESPVGGWPGSPQEIRGAI